MALLCVVLPHGENPKTTLWENINLSDEPLPYWWPDVQTAYRVLVVGLLGFSCAAATTRSYPGDTGVVPERWRKLSVDVCSAVAPLLVLVQVMGTTLVYSRRYIFEPQTGPGLWLTAVAAFLCLAEETGKDTARREPKKTKIPAPQAVVATKPTVQKRRARYRPTIF